MTHFLTIPINEDGIIFDPNIDGEIKAAAVPPFQFTDVFIYSHGWWNTASSAASEYNVFSIGFSKSLLPLIASAPTQVPRVTPAFSALSMGIHWPSMISENQDSVSNFFEATSFFTMQSRADTVGANAGYALLRLLIEARQGQPPLRVNMIGHSFGCRVVCSALESLVGDAATLSLANAVIAELNVVLLQGAMDTGSLAVGGQYGDVLPKFPNLRLLVTVSQNDKALGTWYPIAQNLAHLFHGPVPALGFAGPSGNLAIPMSDRLSLQAFPAPVPVQQGQFAVVDLTPLHIAHAEAWGDTGGWAGQHSDINLPEIYELLARFFGN